jgi:hypothetical protein
MQWPRVMTQIWTMVSVTAGEGTTISARAGQAEIGGFR